MQKNVYEMTLKSFIQKNKNNIGFGISNEYSHDYNLRLQYFTHVIYNNKHHSFTIYTFIKIDKKNKFSVKDIREKYGISDEEACIRIYKMIIENAIKDELHIPENIMNDYLNENTGPKKKSKINDFDLNKQIQEFIADKDSRNESYSKDDIEFIQKYEGSGGLANKGATGTGLLHEFYTPDYICDYLYKFAVKYGYNGGTILEPSIATGRIIKPFVDNGYNDIVGFEINPITARICEITYPQIKVYNNFFETAFLEQPRFRTLDKNLTWLKEYPFSLVIGNPPYGVYQNLYSTYFTPKFKQIEQFFMFKSLQLLKKNGLLIFLTSSNFMYNWQTYEPAKTHIFGIADFVDAYRLPAIFKNSSVPTDILIFRKK